MAYRSAIQATVLLAALSALCLPQSAQATTAREAIRLCEKNPKCIFTVKDNGGVQIVVDGNHISCPQEGPCTCDVCNHPALVSPPKTGRKPPLAVVSDVLKR
jgi:hypothetical protein